MNPKTKKILKSLAVTGLVCLSALPALAAADTFSLPPGAGSGFEPVGKMTLPDLVSGLIRLVLIIAALVAFAFLIFGGVVWITSGGDKAKTESARNTITAALIGLLIVFAAWAVIRLVEVFFQVTILNMTVKPVETSGT